MAQQEASYSQYMYNMMVINPAYAGSREALSATVLYRNQWLGLEGAPVSQSLSLHSLMKNEKVGLGLNITNDRAAIQSNFNIQFAYSYILPLANGNLAFGLQGGAVNYTSDYSKVKFTNPDETVAVGSISKFYPTVGAGLYYHTEKFYLGLSVPRLKAFQGSLTMGEVSLASHYYSTVGINLDISESLLFRPSALIKATNGAPLQTDINASFLYNSFVGWGVSYRHGEAVVGMVQLHWGKIKLGYAYDYGIGAISKNANGSHELYLNFETSLIKDKVVSPRFF